MQLKPREVAEQDESGLGDAFVGLSLWVVLENRVPFRCPFFLRVPYYTWDVKRDPNLENYPNIFGSSLILRGSDAPSSSPRSLK